VGLAVFKTVARTPSCSWEGSTPSHSRHGIRLLDLRLAPLIIINGKFACQL